MAISILHKRGVDANRPVLADGEMYFCTNTKRVFHGSVPNRFVTQVASSDLTAQGAAIATTTLFTPAVTGLYRINIYEKVTRAATTSSTLGAVTIGYTDGTDSVAQTIVAGLVTQAGAVATTNTGNATSSKLYGSVVIFALTAVAVTFAVAYVSSGATTMQFESHFTAEAL